MGGFIAVLEWRSNRLCVIGEPDRLIVRNWFDSGVIAQGNISGFLIKYLLRGPAIYVLLHDGTQIRLDATVADRRIRGSRRLLEPNLALLQGWLRSADT
jgi:hypothetical protein